MPEDNQTTPSASPATASTATPAPATSVADAPSVDTPAPTDAPTVDAPAPTVDTPTPTDAPAHADTISSEPEVPDVTPEVAEKIGEAHNVLIALSSDPSVDEMAAAIGLSIYLDRLGKRATAIYSGNTPNALEFLNPDETFEENVDTLQDFVIALNKEKADHLRYKLDGDFVKIFITPYKTRIGDEDLEFSYGDFNVDLVLALNVANGVDLDTALREHGRIMHDAVIINITTGNPGKFGEIEWSNKKASSVSEMIADLLYRSNSKIEVGKEEATAFLTGIVAATNRFSNAKTTPVTMTVASKLMKSGANQQLISKNITPDVENELFGLAGLGKESKREDDSNLNIQHGNELEADTEGEVGGVVTEKESSLLDDLKAAEASLAASSDVTVADKVDEPVKVDAIDDAIDKKTEVPEPPAQSGVVLTPSSDTGVHSEGDQKVQSGVVLTPSSDFATEESSPDATTEPSLADEVPTTKVEKILQPSSDLAADSLDKPADDQNKYSKMLEDALNQASATAKTEPTVAPATPESVTPSSAPASAVDSSPVASAPTAPANPAAAGAPAAPTSPEINGVPEINYMPMPGDEILPPPPAPPIDMNSAFQIPSPQ